MMQGIGRESKARAICQNFPSVSVCRRLCVWGRGGASVCVCVCAQVLGAGAVCVWGGQGCWFCLQVGSSQFHLDHIRNPLRASVFSPIKTGG